jgi:hypothetical protein
MIAAYIHQSQCMIGIFDGSVVMLEPQPRDSSMVVLEKLSIGIETLVVVHHKVRRLFFQG